MIPFHRGHPQEIRNEAGAACEDGETGGVLVLADVSAFEQPRAVHRREPAAHPTEAPEHGTHAAEQSLSEAVGTASETREHPADALPVLRLLTADLEDFSRFGWVREGPRVAPVRERGGELTRVRPPETEDQVAKRSTLPDVHWPPGVHSSKNPSQRQTVEVHWYISMRTPTTDEILVGRAERMLTQSFEVLRRHLDEAQRSRSPRLSFMTAEHHRVRDFAVAELPRLGRALPPGHIAEKTGLPLERVQSILNELEVHRFFLVRDPERRVSWAFPVTSEKTPHRLELSTGEAIHAA